MPKILIVGAGIGGLAAGLALRRAGWDVEIFERSAGPRAEGFALGLAPNALAALRELGVDGPVRARGYVPSVAEIRWPDGRVLRRISLSTLVKSPEQMMAIILRPALHEVLLDAVGRERISFNSEVSGFSLANGNVTLTMAGGRSVTGDVLVGADGVGSIIRRGLHPGEAPPRRSGHWAIRGVAYDAIAALGDVDAVAYLGDGLESATVRASPNAIYWYVSILAADLPANTRDARGMLDHFAAAFEVRYRTITRETKPEDLRLDELFDRDPIDRWGAGPVTLLGDAAHPMLPHTGQGAAQALEDAVALGVALAPNSGNDPALRRYERMRARRTAAVVKQGRRIARVTTTHNRALRAARDTAIRLIPDFVIRAFV